LGRCRFGLPQRHQQYDVDEGHRSVCFVLCVVLCLCAKERKQEPNVLECRRHCCYNNIKSMTAEHQ
jgi:hypothetical protein